MRETQRDGKNIDGDPDASEVDAYVLKSQQPVAKVGSLNHRRVTKFSANHLALQVKGPEDVHIYPVTIIHEQKPQSLRNATQRPTPVGNNPQGYPDVPAKKRRRIFELLYSAGFCF